MARTAASTVLEPHLAADPGAPLITHYDLAAGSRIELSAVSTANWAAKIAGLLRDEVGVMVDEEVLLDLPAHWLTPGVLLGAWSAGAHVLTPAGSGDPMAVLTVPARLDAHPSGVEALAMSTDPMGRGIVASGGTIPPGVGDLVDACRIHPDSFTESAGATLALDEWDPAALRARSDAGPGARLLVVDDGTDPLPRLAAHLLAGASLVLVSPPAGPVGPLPVAEAELETIASTEKTTGRG